MPEVMDKLIMHVNIRGEIIISIESLIHRNVVITCSLT